jgi:hypothetical protein
MTEVITVSPKVTLWIKWLKREHNQTFLRLSKSFTLIETSLNDMLYHVMVYDYDVFQEWACILKNEQCTKNHDYCVAWQRIVGN